MNTTDEQIPAEAPEAAPALGDLADTVACPACHVAAGARCVTRAGKPAREPHSRRFEALEQAAGITQHRATGRHEAQARGYTSYCYDHKAEDALLTAYAARVKTNADADRAAERAATDEPIPAEVAAAAPGAVIVTHDHGMTHHVWRNGEGIGVLFDETPAGLPRGGWCAWSPKSSNRGGIVGWYATKEEAAAAVAETWPVPAAEEPARVDEEPADLDVHVVSYLGGKVHTQAPGLDGHPWPLCRGGMNQMMTKFHVTQEPLSCSHCVEYASRRAARAAR